MVVKVAGPDIHLSKGDVVIEVDQRYYRPTEVDILQGMPVRPVKIWLVAAAQPQRPGP